MSPFDATLPCGCPEKRHQAGLECLARPSENASRGPGGPYRSPDGPDRIDARRLLDTDPTARAFHDAVAAFYLRGTLTVAELRVLFTMGLECGMARETAPGRRGC